MKQQFSGKIIRKEKAHLYTDAAAVFSTLAFAYKYRLPKRDGDTELLVDLDH